MAGKERRRVFIGHQPPCSLCMGHWSPSTSLCLGSLEEDLKVQGQILLLFCFVVGLGAMSSSSDPLLKGSVPQAA